LAIVATGCQHPLAPILAGPQPAGVNHAMLDAQATARVQKAMQQSAPTVQVMACVAEASAPESPETKTEPQVAKAQQKPDCLEGQLADGLMLVFKTFTGRH
jgi:hypothetical protein